MEYVKTIFKQLTIEKIYTLYTVKNLKNDIFLEKGVPKMRSSNNYRSCYACCYNKPGWYL